MNLRAFKEQLAPFIAIQSISTDPAYKKEVVKAAEWLEKYLGTTGFTVRLFQEPHTNPLVCAEYKINPKLQTILLYGHYDVVPADQPNWQSDPFTLTERNGYLYGRGTADDKGQLFIHLFTLAELIKSKKLAFNIKLLLEGNEETGNDDLSQFITENKALLNADIILISDGPQVGDRPTIEASLRAAINLTLKFTSGTTLLHNGLYGGAVPNAATELTKLVAKLTNTRNEVQIPGFYDDVALITPEECQLAAELINDEANFCESIGVKTLLKPKKLPFYIQTGLMPTIQVSSFHAGYLGTGHGGSIPNEAEVKLNVRFVKNQNPQKLLANIKNFISKNSPTYITHSLTATSPTEPVKIDIKKPVYTTLQTLVKEAYGKPARVRFVGGSIPVIADFQKLLKVDPLVISLANEDSNEHGPNENLSVKLLEKACHFSKIFFSSQKVHL